MYPCSVAVVVVAVVGLPCALCGDERLAVSLVLSTVQLVHEEASEKSKRQMRRFTEWQQEVRESREMLLEDLKAQARARGEDDSLVTLPRRCYVSYGKAPQRRGAEAEAAETGEEKDSEARESTDADDAVPELESAQEPTESPMLPPLLSTVTQLDELE